MKKYKIFIKKIIKSKKWKIWNCWKSYF